MSEELLIRCCAPTLASIKTGSLFSCRFASLEEMTDSLRMLNRRLGRKGLRALSLRYSHGTALIYLYRPNKLRKDLTDKTACQLLNERCYPCGNVNQCVRHLKARIAAQPDFPHEIGLFLGYPPTDVEGFITRKPEAKASGLWKVYGDVDAAERKFSLYRKCTAIYLHQWQKGSALERLAVREM